MRTGNAPLMDCREGPRALAWFAMLLLLVLIPLELLAFPVERRRIFEDREENVYLAIPAVASLPGIGLFVGGLASVSNIMDTGMDLALTVAESVDSSEISVEAIAFRDLPLYLPGLTMDYHFANAKLGNFQTYLPGRNSPNFTIPFTGEFDIEAMFLNLRLFQRRFNLIYFLGFFGGYQVGMDGNETKQARHTAGANLLLDLTDDVVDPRTGLRVLYTTTLKAPKKSFMGSDTESAVGVLGDISGVKREDLNLALYFALSQKLTLAWDTQYSWATGAEDTDEVVPANGIPLRGYPLGRWRDRYGIFTAVEARYTYPLNRRIDMILARGTLDGIQLAAFYELGQVNPDRSGTLFSELHHSYGGGFRALLDAIVLRFDLANGDEGVQTHLTIGQHF